MTSYEADNLNVVEQCLVAPQLDQADNATLDPSDNKAIITVAPYPDMACGDKLVMFWSGIDSEGVAYRHEVSRFVSEAQVGRAIVFCVSAVHITALDGGSLEVYYALYTARFCEPVESGRLYLSVGDARPDLLPVIVNDAVGGTLDPDRVVEGARVTIRPYARMAPGDRVLLSWAGATPQASFNDTLKVESFAVGGELSFWVSPDCIASNLGAAVTIGYCVEQKGQASRFSELAPLLIGALEREPLLPPTVLEADEGWLDVQDAIDGVTVVIDNAQAEEGELVYLKCDGEHFNHRDDREVSREMAGQPLVFIVPYRFWREHQDLTVRVAYSVERLDDVSQQSEATLVQVHS
ncbi:MULTISPECIES: hypothetical protein [Gammaproteobacteria]|uniref:hypothetical protein n=1 Tax=Gammaproteobacteria TaxID=1236 RepID=UPI001912C700|nr:MULTISPECIES: hypothetical protein [Gammaproteobacteria]MBK5304423.1 hypothetical protein [Bacillus sp. TH86]MBK5324192.1 hypothetical protein [Bacillus sp. TH59]MBK5339142.1 hypothetical protein [Bacillus sp. TH57]MBK5313191.1 hypothetical protein [Pseudomonas sp. TH71]MBK5318689.1 hypothetical protein [Erwinia sp. TH79]